MSLVNIVDLNKQFGEKKVLKGLNLSLEAGRCYTLLGKNGAGKTTLISLLLGLLKDYSGEIELNLNKKREIGVVFQEDIFPKNVKVQELVNLQASFYGEKVNAEQLLGELGLSRESEQMSDTLSGGQKRRLSFLLATVHDPELIILDEPTSGMDYDSVENFVSYIKKLKKAGKTIFLITHDLYQIEEFSDYILFLNNGVLEENISVDSLVKEEVYEFPQNLISGYDSSNLLYRDQEKIVIEKQSDLDEIILNNIKNISSYKRQKQIIDIFKKIAFLERKD